MSNMIDDLKNFHANLSNLDNIILKIKKNITTIIVKNQTKLNNNNISQNKPNSSIKNYKSSNQHFQKFKLNNNIKLNRISSVLNKNNSQIDLDNLELSQNVDTVSDHSMSNDDDLIEYNNRKDACLTDNRMSIELNKEKQRYSIAEITEMNISNIQSNLDSKIPNKIQPKNRNQTHSYSSQFTDSYKLDKQNNIYIFLESKLAIQNPKDSRSNLIQISDDSSFTQIWNVFILVIMIQMIVLFPFELFSEVWLENSRTFIYINAFIETFFIFDIIIIFFTSFRNEYGHQIRELQSIAGNYFRSWFILDLIAGFPVSQFSLLNYDFGNNNNLYFKVFKIPRLLRVFKSQMNIIGSRMSQQTDLDYQIDKLSLFSVAQMNSQISLSKYLIYFFLITNILVCYNISFTYECITVETCTNWFFYLMQDQYHQSINNPADYQYKIALKASEKYSSTPEAQLSFYNSAQAERTMLQANSWQFVLQTVTTVGQGDVGTDNTQERLFRIACMIIGVLLFTQASSSFLETTITETINIYKSTEHETMIEKIAVKYEFRGESRRQLNLLGDSVYTEPLINELIFAKKLPKQMSDLVLKHIWQIQQNKLNILKDESLNLFLIFMKESHFRRCVFDEIIEPLKTNISFVQNGQIGCYIKQCNKFLGNKQLQNIDVGGEFGQQSQINYPKSTTNQIQSCISNSELVEIDIHTFYYIMLRSNKGILQIQNKVEEFFIDLQLIIALQQIMLSSGQQIDLNWQQRTIANLNFKQRDQQFLDQIQKKYVELNSKNHFDNLKNENINEKWYDEITNNNILKYIRIKARILMKERVKESFPLLIINN